MSQDLAVGVWTGCAPLAPLACPLNIKAKGVKKAVCHKTGNAQPAPLALLGHSMRLQPVKLEVWLHKTGYVVHAEFVTPHHLERLCVQALQTPSAQHVPIVCLQNIRQLLARLVELLHRTEFAARALHAPPPSTRPLHVRREVSLHKTECAAIVSAVFLQSTRPKIAKRVVLSHKTGSVLLALLVWLLNTRLLPVSKEVLHKTDYVHHAHCVSMVQITLLKHVKMVGCPLRIKNAPHAVQHAVEIIMKAPCAPQQPTGFAVPVSLVQLV
jgi:hypothetical protein